MKRIFLLLVVFTLLSTGLVCAQETRRISLGAGLEGNMNSRRNWAMGEMISFDYAINRSFSAGLKVAFSQNFGRVLTGESAAFFRWNITNFSSSLLFVQGDLGASFLAEDGRLHPVIMGGISGGIRIPLANWYVEPYIRGGYPFIVGAGIIAGYRF